MAEKALQKVEDQLSCSVCLDTYTMPKLLQCFHVYCQRCLVKLVAQNQQGQLGLPCPICRQVTPIPDNGVAGLRPAFHINRLLEIMSEHKKAADSPGSPASPESVESAPTNLTPTPHTCPEHDKGQLELFCETCTELICFKCAIKGGKHSSHDYMELDKAYETYKIEIKPLLESLEKQQMTIEKALEHIDTCCGEISFQRAATEDKIHATFGRLRNVLNVRETELIGQLHQFTQSKLKGLAAQKDQIETTQAQLSSTLHFMKESLKSGTQEEVLKMKSAVTRQAKELASPLQEKYLEPITEAGLMFLTSQTADITTSCQSYGKITTPDPSKCHTTTFISDEVALEVGNKYTTVVQVVGSEDQLWDEPIKSIKCELVLGAIKDRVRSKSY